MITYYEHLAALAGMPGSRLGLVARDPARPCPGQGVVSVAGRILPLNPQAALAGAVSSAPPISLVFNNLALPLTRPPLQRKAAALKTWIVDP
jgi:hypothetical protein